MMATDTKVLEGTRMDKQLEFEDLLYSFLDARDDYLNAIGLPPGSVNYWVNHNPPTLGSLRIWLRKHWKERNENLLHRTQR